MATFTRRDFLRLASATILGGVFSSRSSGVVGAAPSRLGRVATDYLRIHQKASAQSKVLGWKGFDEIVPIVQDVVGDDKKAWIEIGDGFILAADVQPVTQKWNKAITSIAKPGIIGEITIPFTDARRKPDLLAPIAYRLYFSSTYWVKELVYDMSNRPWYKLYDERLGIYYYADARAIRLVPASELTPLSPNAADKHLVVSLEEQRVTAYEGRAEVFNTQVSTGRIYLADDGTAHSWTPSGKFIIDRKRPSRHMGFGEAAGSDYELPGVPWVSYFHWKGYSFHGTWWHNDYGRPRSAGCVNMRSDEAKWLYRWSLPTAPVDQEVFMSSGTSVEITED